MSNVVQSVHLNMVQSDHSNIVQIKTIKAIYAVLFITINNNYEFI